MYNSLLKHEHRDAPALYFGDKTVTYPVLLGNIRKMASFYRCLGVKKGDTVTVSLPNLPTTVYTLYALNALGAVQNIIHPLTPASEIVRTAEETGSVLIVALSTLYKEHGQTFSACGIPTVFANPMADVSPMMRCLCDLKLGKPSGKNGLYPMERYRKEKEIDSVTPAESHKTCIYLHSGGTTDVPKIIELSADALNNLVEKCYTLMPFGIDGKSILAVLPSFHGFGLGMGIHAPLYWGAASALMTKFSIKQTIKWINQGKINVILGVPLLYQKLMKEPAFSTAKLSHLECAFVGGDNVPPSLIESFNTLMAEKQSPGKMLEGYGLTETVTVCSVNTHENFRHGSVGKPLEGMEFTVRDQQQAILPAGTVGEVYIAGNTLMNGYRGDEAATQRTMVELEGKTWVRSGDLGYLDEDGYLFLKSRIKRVFKIAGINIYPAEVEKIATDLVEDVHDAALELFETPKPHLVLFLIRNRESTRTEEEIRALLTRQIGEKLTKYCMPEKIVFLESFPKTKVGKTDHKAFTE